jgi:hypothetical protein
VERQSTNDGIRNYAFVTLVPEVSGEHLQITQAIQLERVKLFAVTNCNSLHLHVISIWFPELIKPNEGNGKPGTGTCRSQDNAPIQTEHRMIKHVTT